MNRSVNAAHSAAHVMLLCRDTDLLEDDNLVGCLQVLKLVGYQDTKLVLQQATDTPEDTQTVNFESVVVTACSAIYLDSSESPPPPL